MLSKSHRRTRDRLARTNPVARFGRADRWLELRIPRDSRCIVQRGLRGLQSGGGGDALIILNPAQLEVAGDITEHHIPFDTVPCATRIPQAIGAGVEPMDERVSQLVPVKARGQ